MKKLNQNIMNNQNFEQSFDFSEDNFGNEGFGFTLNLGIDS